MVLELLVALPLGYFLFRRRDFALAYSGWLAALFAAPVFLLYPLFMVIFGRNEITLIIMGFLPGVIPLIIQVEQGFRGVSSTLINVGRSVGVTAWQNFWKIMIPAAAPNIFTGFRLALIYTLLDCAAEIGEDHLRAALSVWDYCGSSARFIWGDALGDPSWERDVP